MSAKRHERTAARRAALQVLYSSELVGAPAAQLIDEGRFLEDEDALSAYAIDLAKGTAANQGEIDAYLKDASDNWSLDRMPVVDRCLLRMAVYEMIYVDKVPLSVSINEAVDLAKEFGGEDESSRFVNGVLGRIAKVLQPVDAEAAACDDADQSGEVPDGE
ncbi:MAG: transcription antitermination factor NusB [Coriobacteriia bacterium]|nr:transcription antitermination factor NusB [Coriobacteriia bacterium]